MPLSRDRSKPDLSTNMISAVQGRKLIAMSFLMVIAFAGLGYRLVDLQVHQHARWREESEDTSRRLFLRAPRRGDIRDIRGNLLAGSVVVKRICADPSLIGEHRGEVAQVVAPLLGMSEADVLERLQPRLTTNGLGQWITNQFVVLKHKVPVETWEEVQAALQRLPLGVDHQTLSKRERTYYRWLRDWGLHAIDDQLRVYPNQRLAAHVLGYVGVGEADTPKGKVIEIEGKDGIELALDAALRGVVGWRSTEVARQKERVAYREQDIDAHPGRNVILSIDAGVQHIVETELAEAAAKHTPISVSAVVVRPNTGEILAMATLPNFDPNPDELMESKADHRRNRVISDLAEPGSTFKIVVVSGALNDGLVTLDDHFDCENGLFYFGGKPLRDHERYGILSVEEIITHSSNIGAAKIGIRMGPHRLYQYMRGFGFGAKTGIPLVGERTGLVYPVSRWTKLSISRIPMGHEVAVTPLQMVMAMAAVANQGRLMRPMLVDRLEDEQGRVVFRNTPQMVRQAISPAAAQSMVEALKTVVSTNATGRRAILEHYTAAGKTGTAQKIVNRTYRHDKHFSSFIGFFPADDPEVCIGVFLDEPKQGYYGGEAAAPVFREIAERLGKYLAIPPDVAPMNSRASPAGPTVAMGQRR